MKRSKALLLNTLLLTCAAMLMRGIGVLFQVYLSNKIGSAGVGLFGLISSVELLAITFAASGVRFATTRLVSEELGLGHPGSVRRVVVRCTVYALFFGCTAALCLYNGADYIGTVWIGDDRTVLPLRILSLSLPFFSMSAALGGYFTAVQRVVKSAGVQLTEHLIRIFVIVRILMACPPGDLEYACAAVVSGSVVAEFVSFFLILLLYRLDLHKIPAAPRSGERITRRLFHIATPLALSAYARSALSTLEHMLVPRGLKQSGVSSESALASYGAIHGMVFPVIVFPSALFTSLGELIVPELTAAQMAGNDRRISYLVNKVLKLCAIFSIGIAGIFFYYSDMLSGLIYQAIDVSGYMRIFSLLIPVIYLDAVVDGMLKGLGQQMHSMAYNITDSLISVILVYLFLPKYSINAYIGILYFTECFNFLLSAKRLAKVAKPRIKPETLLIPALCIIGAGNLAMLILRGAGVPLETAVPSVVFHIVLTCLLYYLLLRLLSCITKGDVQWARKVLQ